MTVVVLVEAIRDSEKTDSLLVTVTGSDREACVIVGMGHMATWSIGQACRKGLVRRVAMAVGSRRRSTYRGSKVKVCG